MEIVRLVHVVDLVEFVNCSKYNFAALVELTGCLEFAEPMNGSAPADLMNCAKYVFTELVEHKHCPGHKFDEIIKMKIEQTADGETNECGTGSLDAAGDWLAEFMNYWRCTFAAFARSRDARGSRSPLWL